MRTGRRGQPRGGVTEPSTPDKSWDLDDVHHCAGLLESFMKPRQQSTIEAPPYRKRLTS